MLARNKRCGFTLVELLVVMAIIMVLAGLLVGGLHAVRSSGYEVKCQSNLRAIGSAFNAYQTEYKGWMPYGLSPTTAVEQTADKGRAVKWKYDLSYYIGNYSGDRRARRDYPLSKAFFDPIAGQGKGNYFLSLKQFGYLLLVWRPLSLDEGGSSISNQAFEPLSIWHDGWTLDERGDRQWEARSVEVPPGYMQFSSWKEPSISAIVTEAKDPKVHRAMAREATGSNTINVEYRHKGRANVLFLDGHVESFAQGDEMLFRRFDLKVLENPAETPAHVGQQKQTDTTATK